MIDNCFICTLLGMELGARGNGERGKGGNGERENRRENKKEGVRQF